MNNPWPKPIAAFVFAAVALLAGCQSTPPTTSGQADIVDLNAALAQADAAKQPLVLLVVESGQSEADDAARAMLESGVVKARSGAAKTVLLDISVSRNRAVATRFHVVTTPLLLCLSSRGIIASRDEPPISKDFLLQRIGEVERQGPDLDTKVTALEIAARHANNTDAEFGLADFLLAHHNAFEAIPPLAVVAHSEANPPAVRVRAWVELIRAHFWIAEPEKARHEAAAMIATLGPGTPEAGAAANLVLGLQDITTKRVARARKELEEAVSAAPDSVYGKQASQALANLPGTGQ